MVEFIPELQPKAVECPNCDKAVIAEPKGFVVSGMDVDEEQSLVRWTLYACEKQHPILMREEELGSEYGGGGYISIDFDDDPYRVYPPRDRVLSNEIPVQLRQIHEEARACIRAKAYTAAAVMSGRALEGVCDLHGVKGHSLQSRLANMKTEGLIDGRLWEWAETLRAVRNSAAHFTIDPISKQDAEDAVAFTEALLDYLYVLTTRFNALKERRTKQSEERDAKEGETKTQHD